MCCYPMLTALFVASENDHLEVTRLFAGGVDKDKAMHDAANPLHIAAGKGRLQLVRFLLTVNVDKGHFRVEPPLCMLCYERTVGDCAAVAAGQCREGQGSSQWHHPCVHRSSEWAVGSCVAFCWLPMRIRTRPTGVAKPRRESQLRMVIWRSPAFCRSPQHG